MASSNREDDDQKGPLGEAPRVGDVVLGSFELLETIGCGGFATAYLAHQIGTDRKAVVKVPHRHLLDGKMGAQLRARFAAELRASSRVNHPNIATVYTAGDTHGSIPVIAMEYIRGRALRSVLKKRVPLPPRSVAKLAYQMASALAAIHEADIVHRDVTPGNIILGTTPSKRERYVLLDFGVARLSDSPSQTIGPLGTPRYMPREQIKGRTVPKSDMFALGAILWWAVTGQEFLCEIDDIHSLLLSQVQRSEAPDPRSLKPGLATPVAEVIKRLLSTSPLARPTAREFLAMWPRVTRAWAEALHRRNSSPHLGLPAGDLHTAEAGDPASLAPTPLGVSHEAGQLDDMVDERPNDYAEYADLAAPGAERDGSDSLPGGDGDAARAHGAASAGEPGEGLGAELDDDAQTLSREVTLPRPTSALVVDTNPVRRGALVAALTAQNCQVFEGEPGDAPGLALDRAPDLILCSQSLDDGTGMEVLQAIHERLGWRAWPTTVLVVRKGGAPENWQRAAEHCIALPDEADALRGVVEAVQPPSQRAPAAVELVKLDRSSENSQTTEDDSLSRCAALKSLGSFGVEPLRATIAHFGGVMPEWLQDLSEALERADAPAICSLSRRIGEAGELVGATHLARLGEIVTQLGEAGLLEQLDGFVHEIEAEFTRVFHELLQIDGIHT
ncbi:serine/threonine-protein kinase [Haliangium ochraceum]|uniref:Serine/threonine protein kinase n=1 Tax=Haliangium ochraceum (strain DSM 14365 / JCM 11303 / SMP-2) TaxID=502025 RepID=D0LX12_HALO1|nr:serine/threonine-protein kinase [Haliangium ochraceum]ACY14259.1 serine/threonine protein kinase [Haliangium ochraceum DSM 14365]